MTTLGTMLSKAITVVVLVAIVVFVVLVVHSWTGTGTADCVSWQNGALVVSDSVACAGYDAGSNR